MWNHIIAAPAHPKFAHDAAVRPLHDIDDLAVRAPIALQALDAKSHAIAMHGAVGVFFPQVDIALQSGHRLFGRHEPVAVAMHTQTPVNQSRRFLLLRVSPLQVTFRMWRHDSFYSEKAYGSEDRPPGDSRKRQYHRGP